jgi:hypothetical protein
VLTLSDLSRLGRKVSGNNCRAAVIAGCLPALGHLSLIRVFIGEVISKLL